ncbi:Protein translation factor SUI1-like protein [Armadillidium vulgare]|nr:Protein translation factor SUI1-like protein [Armadillidium vulgare]
MSIQNLNTFDPFADAARGSEDGVQDGLVHIRYFMFCNELVFNVILIFVLSLQVLQLQGDQRENICQFLTKVGLVKAEQIKVHGF